VGAYPNRGGDVGGALYDQGTGPFQEKGGHPVDNGGGNVGGQEPGSEDGGVDVVEGGFDVEKEGGGLEPGSLEGFDFVGEGETGVGGP